MRPTLSATAMTFPPILTWRAKAKTSTPTCAAKLIRLRQLVDRLETETLLSGENDARNAIVTIHPGAGGTESQDWADMLLRMYLRWAERQGFETVLYDYQPAKKRD